MYKGILTGLGGRGLYWIDNVRRRTDCAIPKNNCAVLACIANKALLGARSYLVPDPIRTIMMCGRGGTGRRATLRSLWPKGRGSSSLLDRTKQSCGTSKIGIHLELPRGGAPLASALSAIVVALKPDHRDESAATGDG